MFLGVKERRKIFDAAILVVASVSAFLLGFMQNMDLGALIYALALPNLLILGLSFMHLVLRKGRKYDEKAHRPGYEAVKALLFLVLAASAYYSGISKGMMPSSLVYPGLFSVSFLAGLYLFSYRANS